MSKDVEAPYKCQPDQDEYYLNWLAFYCKLVALQWPVNRCSALMEGNQMTNKMIRLGSIFFSVFLSILIVGLGFALLNEPAAAQPEIMVDSSNSVFRKRRGMDKRQHSDIASPKEAGNLSARMPI
jgi:hypothetical protein